MRIGIDLGGTKIEGIALDATGRELHRLRVSTIRDDYAATISSILGVVKELEEATGATGTVGVGIPGTIVASTGLAKNANSTWLNHQPLQNDLSDALGRPVRCANDANCFAVSEATDGAALGRAMVFGVILGTGCGGGIALQGGVRSGPNGLSGEWGHMPLPWARAEELPGPDCYCGHSGCMEKWVSGTGFERDFNAVSGRTARGKEIAAAAERGDPQSIAALERLADRLARGLAVLVDVLDPDVFVLGGGLSNIDWLYAELPSRIAEWTFGRGTVTPVLKAKHGDSSGVRGAAWLWPPESTAA